MDNMEDKDHKEHTEDKHPDKDGPDKSPDKAEDKDHSDKEPNKAENKPVEVKEDDKPKEAPEPKEEPKESDKAAKGPTVVPVVQFPKPVVKADPVAGEGSYSKYVFIAMAIGLAALAVYLKYKHYY